MLSMCVSHVHAWKVLTGNETTRSNTTFTFDVGPHYVQRENNLMYVGSAQADGAKDYALSRINLHKYTVEPVAPETITRNTTEYDQPNPLYNSAITHIITPSPVDVIITLEKTPSTLYNLNMATADHDLLAVQLVDEQKNECKEILKLATNGKNITFAAVKTAHDTFGLAVVQFDSKQDKELVTDEEFAKLAKEVEQIKDDPKKMRRLKGTMEMGEDGKKYRKKIVKTFKQINNAYELPAQLISLGTNPAQVISVNDLCWHSGTERLYIGLTVKTGDAITDQACAVLVARLNADNSVSFESILKADSLQPSDHRPLVAEVGSRKTIQVNSLAALRTSTGFLDYLVVQTDNEVFALPLTNYWIMGAVQKSKEAEHGTLADIEKNPLTAFESRRMKFLGRHFQYQATTSDQFYNKQNTAAWVGAGPLVAGPISSLVVQADLIFAVVNNPFEGYEAGIYQSQAIFAQNGSISGWTIWQKTAGIDGLDFMVPDSKRVQFLAFSQNSESENGTRVAAVNNWPEHGSDEILQLLETAKAEFADQHDPIKKVIDFSIIHPGLCQKNITMLISNAKIMLAQFPDFKTATIKADDLMQVGTPTCAEIGVNSTHGWVFVGGTNGLACVCDQNGNGWRMPQGLSDLHLLDGMRVKKIGNYAMVRKLIYDAGFLYVLTDETFDRIDLEHDFAITRLATIKKMTDQRFSLFYDAIVSENCALITSSAGLFRVGNNHNIQIDNEKSMEWTSLNVPDATDLPLFLIPMTVSGRACDWARGVGQVYIITGSYTKQGARVHRYAINNPENSPITDSTIEPVADLVIKDHYSDIGNLVTCSDCFATDGLFFFAAFRSKKNKPMQLYNGLTKSRTHINLEIAAEDVITSISRNSYYGNWLIAGSFGLKTNI